jgi:MFS family permease
MIVVRQGGGGGASNRLVTEDAMIIAITLSVAGLGFLCWLAFNLAVHALPLFAGAAAGLFAYHTGAGVFGGASVGLVAGAATVAAGEFAFANSRSTIIRNVTAGTFALPAAVAGYHLLLGISAFGMPSDTWRQLFAIVGAIVVGSTAWLRLKRFDRETQRSTSLAESRPEPTARG